VRCLSLVPLTRPPAAARFLDGYRAHDSLRPAAVAPAVAVCLVEHAVKRWPTEAWLRGAPWAEPHFREHFDVVRTLTDGRAALERFWREAVP
jgi:hypothetical protein